MDLCWPWEALDFILNAHKAALVDFKKNAVARANILTQQVSTENFQFTQHWDMWCHSLTHSRHSINVSFYALPRALLVNYIKIKLKKRLLKKKRRTCPHNRRGRHMQITQGKYSNCLQKDWRKDKRVERRERSLLSWGLLHGQDGRGGSESWFHQGKWTGRHRAEGRYDQSRGGREEAWVRDCELTGLAAAWTMHWEAAGGVFTVKGGWS